MDNRRRRTSGSVPNLHPLCVTSKLFLAFIVYLRNMPRWTFLSNHGRALLCISRDPEARLRDIAADLGVTERSAYAIVSDLAEAGYITKERDGRRNRYEITHDLRLPEAPDRDVAIGEVLRALDGRSGQSKRKAS